MRQLATRLGVAESTVTRLVDRLEAARLVKRVASPPDRRCVVAELTPSGRRLAEELEASRRSYLAEILGTLRADERRELVRLFAKVAGALRNREELSPPGARS
jgi:DNA-binding MarR family transcriptional regulator